MKRITTLLVILAAFAVLGFAWWTNGVSAVNPADKTPKIFVVKKGEDVRKIASNLKAQGLIKDPIVFFLITKQQGIDKQIQAGDFRLNSSMNAQEIASNLTHGTLDIWVTIPEGLRADEIADILKAKAPSYKESWRSELENNEGYLFPDTYLIPRDADINLVISLLKNNFAEKFASVKNSKPSRLSDADSVIVASIIEREAIFDEDRPVVASVIINRLNLGMALGVDPTIQYALGYQTDTKSWWKKDLTIDDLAIKSPYNTRKVTGLPPTPISNPGVSAIRAALNPANSYYLYYYSDKEGHLHFATTLEGHNANIKKYQN